MRVTPPAKTRQGRRHGDHDQAVAVALRRPARDQRQARRAAGLNPGRVRQADLRRLAFLRQDHDLADGVARVAPPGFDQHDVARAQVDQAGEDAPGGVVVAVQDHVARAARPGRGPLPARREPVRHIPLAEGFPVQGDGVPIHRHDRRGEVDGRNHDLIRGGPAGGEGVRRRSEVGGGGDDRRRGVRVCDGHHRQDQRWRVGGGVRRGRREGRPGIGGRGRDRRREGLRAQGRQSDQERSGQYEAAPGEFQQADAFGVDHALIVT